jgi:hypothetical protein
MVGRKGAVVVAAVHAADTISINHTSNNSKNNFQPRKPARLR